MRFREDTRYGWTTRSDVNNRHSIDLQLNICTVYDVIQYRSRADKEVEIRFYTRNAPAHLLYSIVIVPASFQPLQYSIEHSSISM